MTQSDACYDFGFERYERPFQVPLKTHYGEWSIRQGIFVYLRDVSGAIGVGEIAPLSWFGTESIEDAIAFCRACLPKMSHSDILDLPGQFPAVQFGLGTALESLQDPCRPEPLSPDRICGLLPAGKTSLTAWTPLWTQGHRTFKWKIGVEAMDSELRWFQSLISSLPPTAKLRLDANGGLTVDQAQRWLSECDRVQSWEHSPSVEYLEQPLPSELWQDLLALTAQSKTAIALDESVATVTDVWLWQERGWPGFYVIKPAIMGFPQTLRDLCQRISNPTIFSSVFESSVGRRKALALADELMTPGFALGFGVDHWLAESPKVSINSSIFS